MILRALKIKLFYLVLLIANPVLAQGPNDFARVNDPTGTPLNIRELRSGKVVCTVTNGERVRLIPVDVELSADRVMVETITGCRGLAYRPYLNPATSW